MAKAVTTFTVEAKGEQYIVHAGDVLPAGHPAVKAHPELFESESAKKAAPKKAKR